MLKSAIPAIVFLFAVGSNASVLCKAWCDSRAAAETGCHHADSSTSPTLAGGDSCQDALQEGTTFVREDVRRVASQDDASDVILDGPRFAFAATCLRSLGNQDRATSDLTRPLTTPLRI